MKNFKNIKKVLSLLIFNFILLTSLAQVPDAINFQAIARDSYGNVMGDTQIMIQLSILEGSANGTQVYREIRTLMTNSYGSFSFQIGREPFMHEGNFSSIDWASGSIFMKVDYDPTASLSFELSLGTIEFVTVPFAFAARDVVYIDANGAVEGDVLVFNETTGKFEPGQVGASSIIWENIENKPNFALVATSGDYSDLINTPEIQEIPENLSEFNNDIGYLTDYTETDPEFSAWDKTTGISITESQISDLGNYIETETDPSVPTGTQAGDMAYWNGTAWVTVAATENEGATLQMIGGIPTWVGGTPPTPNVTNVTNPTTGKIWMDRNLGASQVATSSTDANAYGDLYQWGRAADGHESRTSGTTSTLATSDTPGHGNFITTGSSSPYDWRNPQNDNLWQGVSGTNNPCPSGYRLPTEAEWEAEKGSWSSQNAAGAFASPLKLPVAGFRYNSDGSLGNVGSLGNYWSSSIAGTYSRRLYFSSLAGMSSNIRAYGFSVRCIKD
jgi:uncharacterized protein (TIGR02145 family)